MKKILIIISLVVGLFLGAVSNSAYAFDFEKDRTISEIGSLSNLEKYDEALAKCNLAIQQYPDEADLYYWRAIIKSSVNQKKEALKDYDKVISLNPKDGNAYVMRGICKSDLGDLEGAMADYNKALEINPKDASAYSMRACIKITLGDLDGANHDLDAANKLFGVSEGDLPEKNPDTVHK